MARPIFQNILKYLEADESLEWDTKAKFPKPDEVEREMNCLKYAQFEDRGDTFGNDQDDFTENEDIYFDDFTTDEKKKENKQSDPPSDGTR